MGLENPTYISDLVVSNPTSLDKRKYGDDHLRNLKAAVKNSFPNITGAMTATHDELSGAVFVGKIVMYYGDPVDLPNGWAVCDGTNGTPDMRNLVPVGAGGTYALNATMGAATPTTSSSGGHTPSGTISGTALTESQLPAHEHFTTANIAGSGAPGSFLAAQSSGLTGDTAYSLRGTGTAPDIWPTETVGSGATHTHTLTGDAVAAHTHTVSALQPGRALHFIMWIGV